MGSGKPLPGTPLFLAELDDVVNCGRAVGDAHMREMVIENMVD